MGFGSGGGWRRGLWQVYTWAFQVRRKAFFLPVLKATLGSGQGGFGSRVDSHCYGVWEWRRVAPGVLAGMGFGSGGEWRRGPSQVYTWAFQVRRKTFFLSALKATLGTGKGGFGSRVDSHCYGVWEWRRVAPGVFAGMGFGSGGDWRRGLGKGIGGLFKFGVKLSFYRF